MASTVGRNAPCPCGSGKKYKRCCGPDSGSGGVTAPASSLSIFVLSALVIVAVGLLVAAAIVQRDHEQTQAWHYDAPNNRHWDPYHNHWHPGPPPHRPSPAPPAEGPTVSPRIERLEPPPHQHDAGGNRHWDPQHGHWHPGPPPEGSTPDGSTPDRLTPEPNDVLPATPTPTQQSPVLP